MSAPHQTPGDVLNDICDGELYRSHPVLQRSEQALQIIGYYDELTLTNPLSWAKKHKIGKYIKSKYAM